MKTPAILLFLTIFSSLQSFADINYVVQENFLACKSLVEHVSKVELGQEYDSLQSEVTLYQNQNDFNLMGDEARFKAIVREDGGDYYEYAMTVSFDSKNYKCSVMSVDSIPKN